jgi:hypothetical protein
MCQTCNKFDDAISRYRELLKQRFDSLTEERIKAAIVDLEQRKAALHGG